MNQISRQHIGQATSDRSAKEEACRSAGAMTTQARLPIASEVVKRNDDLSDEFVKLADRIESKLGCVLGYSNEAKMTDKPSPPQEVYPPLFDTLRVTQDRMEDSLRRIHSLLDRVEL